MNEAFVQKLRKRLLVPNAYWKIEDESRTVFARIKPGSFVTAYPDIPNCILLDGVSCVIYYWVGHKPIIEYRHTKVYIDDKDFSSSITKDQYELFRNLAATQ